MLFNEPRRRVTQQTWVFNEKIKTAPTAENLYYDIPFVCDNVQYRIIHVQYAIFNTDVDYTPVSGSIVSVYRKNKWGKDAYRTITLLEEPSADLLEFLQKNAVLQ